MTIHATGDTMRTIAAIVLVFGAIGCTAPEPMPPPAPAGYVVGASCNGGNACEWLDGGQATFAAADAAAARVQAVDIATLFAASFGTGAAPVTSMSNAMDRWDGTAPVVVTVSDAVSGDDLAVVIRRDAAR